MVRRKPVVCHMSPSLVSIIEKLSAKTGESKSSILEKIILLGLEKFMDIYSFKNDKT